MKQRSSSLLRYALLTALVVLVCIFLFNQPETFSALTGKSNGPAESDLSELDELLMPLDEGDAAPPQILTVLSSKNPEALARFRSPLHDMVRRMTQKHSYNYIYNYDYFISVFSCAIMLNNLFW